MWTRKVILCRNYMIWYDLFMFYSNFKFLVISLNRKYIEFKEIQKE